MRRLITAAVAAVLMGSVAQGAASVMIGGAHDLQDHDGTTDQLTEICQPCHTPHGAKATQSIPLWNHTATSTDFSSSLYTSATMSQAMPEPAGASLACLSCHDGTVAMDAYGSFTADGPLMGAINGGAADVGTSLTNDHPVGITYATAVTDGDALVAEATVQAAGYLIAGKVECSSCHDAHSTATSLLRSPMANSALCTVCHAK